MLGNARSFVDAMNHHMSNFLTPSLQTAMNELSNHDHSRFLTRTNHMVGRVDKLGPEAASENVSVPVMREGGGDADDMARGSYDSYYGDEAGVCGFYGSRQQKNVSLGKRKHRTDPLSQRNDSYPQSTERYHPWQPENTDSGIQLLKLRALQPGRTDSGGI